jgi:hypothetical protein
MINGWSLRLTTHIYAAGNLILVGLLAARYFEDYLAILQESSTSRGNIFPSVAAPRAT